MTILKKLEFEHFIQMELLEKQFYGEEYITPAQEAFEWYKKYPYSVIAVQFENKIAGFINMFPVSDSVFNKLKSGDFNDKDLTLKDIVNINSSHDSALHMFLSCIVVAEECRKCGTARLLIKEAIKQYTHKEHLFDFILVDAVTNSGKRFAQKYGFKFVCSSNHSSTVYMQSYEDFVSMF